MNNTDGIIHPINSFGDKVGNLPGVCGEPKCASIAGVNSSQITGYAAVWHGKWENPYPYVNEVNSLILSKNQMDNCPTCRNIHNQQIYSDKATSSNGQFGRKKDD